MSSSAAAASSDAISRDAARQAARKPVVVSGPGRVWSETPSTDTRISPQHWQIATSTRPLNDTIRTGGP
jgi:hypothetical protein